MACCRKNCSGCRSCCNNSYARVQYPYVSPCSDSASNSCNHNCNHGCNHNCHRPPIAVPWRDYDAANGFGLLRGVANFGNRRRCWMDYPFYNGPCGPCCGDCGNDCSGNCNDCGNCGSDCGNNCCMRPPFPPPLPPAPPETSCPPNATFIAGSPLTLAAGDNVTLSAINTTTDGFIPTTSGIRILNAGTYMVAYTVQIPAGETVNTRFVLTLDGGNIPSSAMDVVTATTDDSSGSYTMHAIIQAGDNSLLNLTTLSAITLTTATTANAVTLSIVGIC